MADRDELIERAVSAAMVEGNKYGVSSIVSARILAAYQNAYEQPGNGQAVAQMNGDAIEWTSELAAACRQAWNDMYHKCRPEISYNSYEYIWKTCLERTASQPSNAFTSKLCHIDGTGSYPECSGNSECCPENEGHGCCKPNPAATVPPVVQAPSWLDSCSHEEVAAFETFIADKKYDATTHPLHWLYLNEKTYAARQGWKEALSFVRDRLAAHQPVAAPIVPSEPVRPDILEKLTYHKYERDDMNDAVLRGLASLNEQEAGDLLAEMDDVAPRVGLTDEQIIERMEAAGFTSSDNVTNGTFIYGSIEAARKLLTTASNAGNAAPAAIDVRDALQQAASICDEEALEWDSDDVQTNKNYAAHCADRIRALQSPPQTGKEQS